MILFTPLRVILLCVHAIPTNRVCQLCDISVHMLAIRMINESCYSMLQCIIEFLGLFFRSELLIVAVEISSVD